MKRLIIILFLFSAGFLDAQEPFANVDAVYDAIVREYMLNPDGSTVFREYKKVKLLTHASFNRFYGETFIVYNPRYQDLKINESYTIMADGSRIDNPPNAFNPVLPRNASGSAAFNHLREMVVTHTATEIGATLVLDYSLITKKEFFPWLIGNELLDMSSPVRELEVRIIVPKGVTLKYKLWNNDTRPVKGMDGKNQVYVWKFSNTSALSKEQLLPRDYASAARLVFSTAPDLVSQARWVARQASFDYKLPEATRKLVDKILSENTSELKQIAALQKEVVQNMVYDRVEPRFLAFGIRTPTEVFLSNGGSQLEKNVLLAAMLRHAGFDATPVLTGNADLFDSHASNLLQFEEAGVAVGTKVSGTIFISATALEKVSLEQKTGNMVSIPLTRSKSASPIISPPLQARIMVEGNLYIDSLLKLTGKVNAELHGPVNPFLALQDNPRHAAAILSGNVVPSVEGGIGVAECSQRKSVIHYAIEKENFARETGSFYHGEIPVLTTGSESWGIAFLSSQRDAPMALPWPLTETYSFDITLPGNFAFMNLPVDMLISNQTGSVKIQILPDQNNLHVCREFVLNKSIIKPEEYGMFRELFNAWLMKNHRTILFRQTN